MVFTANYTNVICGVVDCKSKYYPSPFTPPLTPQSDGVIFEMYLPLIHGDPALVTDIVGNRGAENAKISRIFIGGTFGAAKMAILALSAETIGGGVNSPFAPNYLPSPPSCPFLPSDNPAQYSDTRGLYLT